MFTGRYAQGLNWLLEFPSVQVTVSSVCEHRSVKVRVAAADVCRDHRSRKTAFLLIRGTDYRYLHFRALSPTDRRYFFACKTSSYLVDRTLENLTFPNELTHRENNWFCIHARQSGYKGVLMSNWARSTLLSNNFMKYDWWSSFSAGLFSFFLHRAGEESLWTE